MSSEEELAATLNSIGDAVIATDSSGRVTRMNPVAERLTGWSIGEAKGRDLPEVFRLLNETTGDVVESPVDRVLRDGVIVGLANHTVLAARDGTERAIANSGAPIRDQNGELRGVVLVFRDQTEERMAERALKQSAARLQILVETSQQFSVASNVDDLLEVIARRLGETVGDLCAIRLVAKDGEWLEPKAALYHHDPEILAAAREHEIASPQRVGEGLSGKVAATGVSILVPVIDTAQLVAQSAPKIRPWIERLAITSLLAVPLKSKTRMIGVINLTRSDPGNPYTADDERLAQDLADRASLAMESALLLNELEERVAQRTAALEEAHGELEAFSYSVAHDLRAPLRAINGFSAALSEDYADKLEGEAKDHLTRIVAGVDRMGQLIDALLALAQLTTTELRQEAVNLGDLARTVIGQLRAAEPTRAVELVAPENLVVRGDPRLLLSLVQNLIGNAWKFTRKRSGAHIELGCEEAAGVPAYYVRDNGAGFDMAFAGRLFAPFRRLHSESEFEGTGIGLATVQRIVRRHGGRVWAQGAVDLGATFRFTLSTVPPGTTP